MKKIRDLFAKDISRRIEEVIKVGQADEQTVREEINEYVVTDAIRDHFITMLKAIAEAPSHPHEGIGVWVSGFFGSGKSSFAKILGYIVAAKKLGDKTATELFKEHVNDDKLAALLDSITQRIPIYPIIFDVSMERGARVGNERITEIMYKALLRELNYAEDFDLAGLEISLEADGKLDKFCKAFEKIHGQPWETRRKVGMAINEASRVLHEIDNKNYPQADSWAVGIGKEGRADITPNLLAERTFELASRRKSGSAIIFVVDEVGQYVSRSVDKMLDLMGVIQAFGVAGKNLVSRRKAPAPCWIVVTSQEKLNEVVDSLESKRIELGRLQDRFSIQIDLKQSDISEVAGKRILEKNAEGADIVKKLFKENEGRLKSCCSFEGAARSLSLSQEEFVHLYPYMPYHIDLCIQVVSGLRLRRGAQRHVGGSNRTIIKQAQEMMLNKRTNLGEASIGTLVTFDKVYELLYLGSLIPSEVARDLDAIPKNLHGEEMAQKAAKVIALLEVVSGVPRTPHNIAALLHPTVESDSIIKEVEHALELLEKKQIIKRSDEGFKLLSAQEKSWDTERNQVSPKPAERNKIIRDVLREIISEVRKVSYEGLRPFKIALTVDGTSVEPDGEINMNISIAEDQEARSTVLEESRRESSSRQEELFWVMTQTEEIERLITELFRSDQMVVAYEQRQARQRLVAEQSSCLADEKIRKDRLSRELSAAMTGVILSGTGYFRGVQRDGSSLGTTLEAVINGFVKGAIPQLYPKLEIGAISIERDTVQDFLKAANLSGLPQLFYDDSRGASLVVRESGRFMPNPSSPLCREILEYLTREHAYGNRVTGKVLESHFEGIGFGWPNDVVRLAIAILLRSGSIEITYQGRKYRDHSEPACRAAFATSPAFRSSSFAPREAMGVKTLAEAVKQLEQMTGKEVEVEEATIAQAFKKLVAEDREVLLSLVARMRAMALPSADEVVELLQRADGILEMSSDDCVRTLAGEGNSYRTARTRMVKLREATEGDNVDAIRLARSVAGEIWQTLKNMGPDEETIQKAQELIQFIESPDFFEHIEEIRRTSLHIWKKYEVLYMEGHEERSKSYKAAMEEIKGLSEWAQFNAKPSISDETRKQILRPIASRCDHDLELPEGLPSCKHCHASASQLESDREAVDSIISGVLARIREILAPEEKIERVRVARFIPSRLESAEDVEEAIQRLREHLMKIVATGAKIVFE